MYSELVILTLVGVICASTDGGVIQHRGHRTVDIKEGANHTHMKTNGRRSIQTHDKTANVVDNQGREQKANKWENTLPLIIFPDQMLNKEKLAAESGGLLNRFEGINKKDDIKASYELNTTPKVIEVKQKPTQSSTMISHETKPITTGDEQTDVKKTSVKGDVTNMLDTEMETLQDGEKIVNNVHGLNNVNTKNTKNHLDDRTAITGDQCPDGKKKLNDKCAEVD